MNVFLLKRNCRKNERIFFVKFRGSQIPNGVVPAQSNGEGESLVLHNTKRLLNRPQEEATGKEVYESSPKRRCEPDDQNQRQRQDRSNGLILEQREEKYEDRHPKEEEESLSALLKRSQKKIIHQAADKLQGQFYLGALFSVEDIENVICTCIENVKKIEEMT